MLQYEAVILKEFFMIDWNIPEKPSKFYSLQKRKEKLNNAFIWTEENKQKILDLNNHLCSLMDSLYDQVAKLKEIHDKFISEGKTEYFNYSIKGSILYAPDNENPALTKREIKMQEALDSFLKWELYQIFATGIPDCTGSTKMPNREYMDSDKKEYGCIDDIDDIDDFQICKPLSIFLDTVSCFAIEDILKITSKDFYTEAEVFLEYDR